MSLSDDLRDLRTELGISLQAAAKLTRTDIVEYGEMERGIGPLDVYSFVRIVRQFLVPHRRRVRANQRRLAKRISEVMSTTTRSR